MYFQGGGSIRFAAGFIAGLLLRETASRKSKKPPRSLLVPANKNVETGEMIFVRQLQADDYEKGFLQLIGQLTTVGNVGKEQFVTRFNAIRGGPEFVFVVEENGQLLASGTILLERKFARNTGWCGHIEDIVVDGFSDSSRADESSGPNGVLQSYSRLFGRQPALLRKVRPEQEGSADGVLFVKLGNMLDSSYARIHDRVISTALNPLPLCRRERLRNRFRAGD